MSIKTCNKDTLYNALDKIKELKKELNKYRWRDVTEELPEENGIYVVLNCGYKELALFEDGIWYTDFEEVPNGDVSHWTEFSEFEELDK